MAIFFPSLVDFVAVALPQAFGRSIAITLLVEGIARVFGLISLWIIWRLREPADQTFAPIAS